MTSALSVQHPETARLYGQNYFSGLISLFPLCIIYRKMAVRGYYSKPLFVPCTTIYLSNYIHYNFKLSVKRYMYYYTSS
jgi:hypothetical protein